MKDTSMHMSVGLYMCSRHVHDILYKWLYYKLMRRILSACFFYLRAYTHNTIFYVNVASLEKTAIVTLLLLLPRKTDNPNT